MDEPVDEEVREEHDVEDLAAGRFTTAARSQQTAESSPTVFQASLSQGPGTANKPEQKPQETDRSVAGSTYSISS